MNLARMRRRKSICHGWVGLRRDAESFTHDSVPAKGELVGAFVNIQHICHFIMLIIAQGLTEPDHGSDPAGMETTAEEVDGGFIINGSKTWISNAPVA